MKIPPPDDWDGESWECFQIRWPKSDKWRAILAGLISQPHRGRLWDERHGSITETQTVALEILRRNWPWRDCAGLTQAPTVGEFHALGACLECDWEALMPCIDISAMLKIENGVLYARNDCCEWVAVGAISGPDSAEALGDTPLDLTEGETPPDYSACGKAAAIVDFAYDLLSAAWQERDEFPWRWVSHIESAMGENMSDKWLVGLVLDLDLIAGLGFNLETIGDPWVRQNLLCRVVNVLNDGTPDGATQDQYEQIKSLFMNDNIVYRSVWGDVWDAMGWKLTNRLATLGATNTTGDCDCPDISFLQTYGPDEAGWYLSAPFTGGMQENSIEEPGGALAVCFADTPAHDCYGVAFKLTWNGATGVVKRMGSGFSPDCSDPVVDSWCWGDTSDQLQQQPMGTWYVCAGNATNRAIGAALLAGQAVVEQSDNSNFGTVIATPGVSAAGENLAGVVYTNTNDPTILVITEVRWLQNTGSPSHA